VARRGRTRKNRLDKAAIGIGRTLGHAAARLDEWRRQGDEIAAEIRHVVDTGSKMLSELGHSARTGTTAVRTAVREVRKGRKKGFKMSEATKKKLRAAWKRRKAEQKAKKTA
jgi:ElaB/YqjD/DUF883 family membrane-anchored ribosome-binding protein